MSNRYKGGIISATPPTTTGGESGTASGAWTLEQQMQAQAAGLWPAQPTGPWIEDCFSTWLYTGTGATQTITNGIDLAGKGGLVWIKARTGTRNHRIVDTARGAGNFLSSDTTSAQTFGPTLTSFNSTGFTLASGDAGSNGIEPYASWTFRKAPKFFDVVTYTGNGAVQTINHNLGSVPGCIIVKRTDSAVNWGVYHRSIASGRLYLNTTDAIDNPSIVYVSSTSTSFTFEAGGSSVNNASGGTYVAYLFAHNAGGFGLSGTDNVISCGSFTTDGSENSTTNLGYEPQWLLLKATAGGTAASQPWHIFDNMRGLTVAGQDDASLQPNNSNAESQVNRIGITSTGFTTNAFGANTSFIYIAIRRGPMRTPTTGTSVFSPIVASTGTQTTGFVVDSQWRAIRSGNAINSTVDDRLRGVSTVPATSTGNYLVTSAISAEATSNGTTLGWSNTGFSVPGAYSGASTIYWSFRRAPGFFDEVCYTGTGTTTTQPHNLGVVPELIIVKRRTGTGGWPVYSATYGRDFYAFLNITQGFASDPGNSWGTTNPTSTTFGLSPLDDTNSSGVPYVAYLFASCPGVSKVGSYTGNGSSQTIDCGFAGGARFVLVKRTDSTGDWYVWDSARGIVAGNDPYLLLNSTAAEVTNTDFVDTAATGFEISSTAPAAINASGGTFIFLAIS